MRQYTTRREFCQWISLFTSAVAIGGFPAVGSAQEKTSAPWNQGSIEFLKEIAGATVKAAHVAPGEEKPGGGMNMTGISLITPGGVYPAFWIRDYAMSLDCGLIGPDEMLPQLKLIARCQNGPRQRKLLTGCIVPPFSIADRIRMDGKPVFYQGIDVVGRVQDGDLPGPRPPADNHYYFTHIAWTYWRETKDSSFLSETLEDLTILDRLIRAFNAPCTDPETGAVVVTAARPGVGFGFEDSLTMQGAMCFVTILRWQAAGQLADLCAAANKPEEEKEFRAIADTIAENIVPVFSNPDEIGGWLLGATEKCRQPDVWATLYALHLGILPDDAARRARDTVLEAARNQNHIIEYQGAVRHVPTTHDFSETTAWEGSRNKGAYQNGAYWHTPTGWLIEVLHPLDPDLAGNVFNRFIAHLKEYDFRKGKSGAPWECFGINLDNAQNPVYMTSVTVPLAILRSFTLDSPQ